MFRTVGYLLRRDGLKCVHKMPLPSFKIITQNGMPFSCFYYILFIPVHLHMCVTKCVQYVCGSQRITLGKQFPPSTMQATRSSGWVSSKPPHLCTCCAISLLLFGMRQSLVIQFRVDLIVSSLCFQFPRARIVGMHHHTSLSSSSCLHKQNGLSRCTQDVHNDYPCTVELSTNILPSSICFSIPSDNFKIVYYF